MSMTAKNYNNVRYELTEALRQVELLFESLENKSSKFSSEVDYWKSSIELLRQCLYDCADTYDGLIDLPIAISEIKDEISNAYSLHYSWLKESQQNRLRFAWLRLEKAKGHLL